MPPPPSRRSPIRKTLLTLTLTALITTTAAQAKAPPTAHRLTPAAKAFREQTYRTHPCLAQIIDRYENGEWDPTLDYGGGHGNTSQSYGLPQANPGTKMASAGPLWRTDRATQLRWMLGYVQRYGGECAALAYRQAHGSY